MMTRTQIRSFAGIVNFHPPNLQAGNVQDEQRHGDNAEDGDWRRHRIGI